MCDQRLQCAQVGKNLVAPTMNFGNLDSGYSAHQESVKFKKFGLKNVKTQPDKEKTDACDFRGVLEPPSLHSCKFC